MLADGVIAGHRYSIERLVAGTVRQRAPLAGTADVDDVLQPYGDGDDDDDLSVIAAGPTPPNPGELLASTQMSALLA